MTIFPSTDDDGWLDAWDRRYPWVMKAIRREWMEREAAKRKLYEAKLKRAYERRERLLDRLYWENYEDEWEIKSGRDWRDDFTYFHGDERDLVEKNHAEEIKKYWEENWEMWTAKPEPEKQEEEVLIGEVVEPEPEEPYVDPTEPEEVEGENIPIEPEVKWFETWNAKYYSVMAVLIMMICILMGLMNSSPDTYFR